MAAGTSLSDGKPNPGCRISAIWQANPVLQLGERRDPFRLEEIAAHGKDLAELDGDRPEVTQQRDDCLGPRVVERLVPGGSEAEPGGQSLQPVAGEQHQNMPEPLAFLQPCRFCPDQP
jgi:hypothetical protein